MADGLTKLGGAGGRFGGCFMCGLRQFALHKLRQSVYKHKVHQPYDQNFEV